MNNDLKICVYGKRTNKPSLVFRKGKILYRIARLLNTMKVETALNRYVLDLNDLKAKPEFILEIESVKNRRRVLEIGFMEGEFSLYVFEMLGEPKLRFRWCGSKEDLIKAFV